MTEHLLPSSFLHREIRVTVVGAGGNGSQFVNGLARLHLALRSAGHPHGLKVQLYDPDRITDANVGRQLFSPADVGQHKATVLIHRLNLFFGLDWQAVTSVFPTGSRYLSGPAILVGCVDTAAARREIHDLLARSHSSPDLYWLDLGNEASTGQVVLGSGRGHERLDAPTANIRLPFVTELFPALLDRKAAESNTPSCSLAEALGKQDLFINQAVTTQALQLLWTFFRRGRLSNHGSFINLEAGMIRPLPIDPETWARMGYGQKKAKAKPPREPVTRQRKKGKARQ